MSNTMTFICRYQKPAMSFSAPASIEDGSILLNMEDGAIYARLAMKNTSNEPLSSAAVLLSIKGEGGVDICKVEYTYNAFTPAGGGFGETVLIPLSIYLGYGDIAAGRISSFDAAVSEVAFVSGNIWEAGKNGGSVKTGGKNAGIANRFVSVDPAKTAAAPKTPGAENSRSENPGSNNPGQNNPGVVFSKAKNPKPNKKKLTTGQKTGILIGAGAVIVFCLLLFVWILPESRYQKGSKAFNSGNYEEAYRYFDGLRWYRDGNDRARTTQNKMLEARYNAAEEKAAKLEETGEWKQAYEVWKYLYLSDSSERAQQVLEHREQEIYDLLNERDFDGAMERVEFLRSNSYPNIEDIYALLEYRYGCSLIQDGDYEAGEAHIEWVQTDLGYYGDDEWQQLAMYLYVKENYDRTDWTTYEYLQRLKEYAYPGSDELYDELYRWGLTNVRFNFTDDDVDETNYDTISRSDANRVYMHYTVTGGEPGAYLEPTYTFQWEGEECHTYEGLQRNSGETSWFFPGLEAGHAPGTVTFIVYDKNGDTVWEGTLAVE